MEKATEKKMFIVRIKTYVDGVGYSYLNDMIAYDRKDLATVMNHIETNYIMEKFFVGVEVRWGDAVLNDRLFYVDKYGQLFIHEQNIFIELLQHLRKTARCTSDRMDAYHYVTVVYQIIKTFAENVEKENK